MPFFWVFKVLSFQLSDFMNAKISWSSEREICSFHFPGARRLFGLERKVGRHVATLDLDFLCRRRSHGSRFAMIRLEGVSAVRHVLDGVFAILITYREVRMIHYAHVGEHPRMHVALEPQERFGAWEGEREVRTASHLRSVAIREPPAVRTSRLPHQLR